MIKAAAGLIKKLTAGQNVHEALARRAQSHLEVWRDLVNSHADGKAIDLSLLESTGNALRLRDTAKCFSTDVAAVIEERSAQESADKTYAHADDLQPMEDAAQKQLRYYLDNFQKIQSEAQQASWVRASAARLAAEAMFIRRKHPRLWSDAFADEGEDVAKGRLAVDEVEPESDPVIPTPRAPTGGALELEASWEK